MCVIARRPEVEQYSDGTPVEGGYLDQICQGKYYNMPEELKWKDMDDKYLCDDGGCDGGRQKAAHDLKR